MRSYPIFRNESISGKHCGFKSTEIHDVFQPVVFNDPPADIHGDGFMKNTPLSQIKLSLFRPMLKRDATKGITGSYFFKTISSLIRGVFLRWKRQYVEIIPIKIIDCKNPLETSLHTDIITNVDLMLQLNKDLEAATLPDQKGYFVFEDVVTVLTDRNDPKQYAKR
jgi:hypothetical protein